MLQPRVLVANVTDIVLCNGRGSNRGSHRHRRKSKRFEITRPECAPAGRRKLTRLWRFVFHINPARNAFQPKITREAWLAIGAPSIG
jgi:hypothetical protein